MLYCNVLYTGVLYIMCAYHMSVHGIVVDTCQHIYVKCVVLWFGALYVCVVDIVCVVI